MYMWSASERGPPDLSTLQGKDGFKTPNGVSQTCTKAVDCDCHLLQSTTDHLEFRKDVIHPSVVGSTVHKHNDPLSAVDHLAQGRPVSLLHGFGGRNIDQWRNPGIDECRMPDILGGFVLRVCENEGQDFVRVRVEPPFYVLQVIWLKRVSRWRRPDSGLSIPCTVPPSYRTYVVGSGQKRRGNTGDNAHNLFHESRRVDSLGHRALTGMAKMQLSFPHVGLRLQQPNSQIELGGHIDLLIPGQVQNVGVNRVAVMTPDERDIAVASVTKLGTAIADGGALLCQGRCAGDRGEQEHEEGRERMHLSGVRGGGGSVYMSCVKI